MQGCTSKFRIKGEQAWNASHDGKIGGGRLSPGTSSE
jgi:hypothetical protein